MYISKNLFISVGFITLKELAKRVVIKYVANRQSIQQLSLPKSIIQDLLNEYSSKLIIKPISLSISDKAAAPFMLLEYNLWFGVTYFKTFLGIVINNSWIINLSHRWLWMAFHFNLIHSFKNPKWSELFKSLPDMLPHLSQERWKTLTILSSHYIVSKKFELIRYIIWRRELV